MPKPRRILLVNGTSEIGGADIDLLAICAHLPRDRYEAMVVLPHTGPLCDDFLAHGIRLFYLDPAPLKRLASLGETLSYPWRFGRAVWSLFHLIRRERPDIVQINSAVLPAAALAARLAGVKCLWHLREIELLQRSRLIGALLRRCILEYADRIVAISQVVAGVLKGRNRNCPQVIYHGVDTSRFHPGPKNQALRQALKIPAHAKVIGYIGRLSPIKGLEYLIDALRVIRRQHRNALLLIVGPMLGYHRYLEQLKLQVAEAGLTHAVIFAGERQDIPEVLWAMDVLVLPTVIPEGLGLVLLEGLACGKPVIATDQGGPAEILRDCAAARLVAPRDSSAIAQAMEYFWELPATRLQEISREGVALVKEQYSMTKVMTKLEEVYDSLLSK